MKLFIQSFIYKAKAARSLRKAHKAKGCTNTYWYQRYVHYMKRLEEM